MREGNTLKTVLILGGTQFFGKRLVHKLLENGVVVTVATRGRTRDDFGDGVERLVIDREKKESMTRAFEGRQWDAVYDQSCFSPLEAQTAYEALEGKIGHYIFTSTMAVYEFGKERKETDFNPLSFEPTFKDRKEYGGMTGYREAKRGAEAYLFQNAKVPVAAVRPALVIGTDDYTERFLFHVDKVKREESIGAKNDNVSFSFTSSEDAAGFLLHIGKEKLTGAYNIAFEDNLSLRELIGKIESAADKTAVITEEVSKENASPYGLPGDWTLDVTKAQMTGYSFGDMNEYVESLIEKLL